MSFCIGIVSILFRDLAFGMLTGERMVHNSVAFVALDYFVIATSLKHSKTQFKLSKTLLNNDFNKSFTS